jgi:hypothetical protein
VSCRDCFASESERFHFFARRECCAVVEVCVFGRHNFLFPTKLSTLQDFFLVAPATVLLQFQQELLMCATLACTLRLPNVLIARIARLEIKRFTYPASRHEHVSIYFASIATTLFRSPLSREQYPHKEQSPYQ